MKNPWRGLAPYDGSEDTNSFCGRKEEQKRLRLMIEDNACLTLYGASGVGKTSLLRAGVLPVLALYNYLPIYIRLSETSSCDVFAETIVNNLEKYAKKNENKTLVETKDFWFLWEYFCTTRFYDEKGKEVIPVLVLDQFEEVFRGSFRESAELLLMQIYTLINVSSFLPDGYHDDRNYRFIISMREDFLFALEDSIDRKGLSLLKNGRFRLRPLDDSQAREVVNMCPELLPSNEEESQRVINALINNSKQDGEISTLLLSLICYQAFEQAEGGIITMETVNTLGDNPLLSFCEKALRNAGEAEKFILESALDDNGFRLPITVRELEKANVPKSLWNVQNPIRLFVKTPRRGVGVGKEEDCYELLHDRLAAALLDRRRNYIVKKQLHDRELKKVQSLYLAEKANNLVDQGDSYTARLLALEALPKDMKKPDRPYVAEAEYALRNADRYDSMIIEGMGNYTSHMGYLSSGDLLVSYWIKLDESPGVTFWSLKTGQLLRNLPVLEYYYQGIGFACHGANIVSNNSNGDIYVWNAKTLKLECKMRGKHNKTIYHIDYDGDYVLSGDEGGCLMFWNARNGKCLFSNQDNDQINQTVLSNKYFAVLYHDSRLIKVWEKSTLKLIREIRLSESEVEWNYPPIVFIDDAVVVGLSTGMIRFFDVRINNAVSEIDAHMTSVTKLFYDGKRLLSGSRDGDVKIWSFNNGVKLLEDLPKHHKGYIIYLGCVGDYVVSADQKVIKKWRTPEPIKPVFEVKSLKVKIARILNFGQFRMTVRDQDNAFYELKLSKDIFPRSIKLNSIPDNIENNPGKKIYDELIIERINNFSSRRKLFSLMNDESFNNNENKAVIRISSNYSKEVIETIGCNDNIVDFEYDGKYIIVVFEDKSVKVWKYLSLREVINHASKCLNGRQLTQEERDKYHCGSIG